MPATTLFVRPLGGCDTFHKDKAVRFRHITWCPLHISEAATVFTRPLQRCLVKGAAHGNTCKERGRFDEMAIAGMEGCFVAYIQDKEEELATLSTTQNAAREKLRMAKENVEGARRSSDRAAEGLKCKKEKLMESEKSVKDAEKELKQHERELASEASKVEILA